jgi:hypothetical protein
LNLKKRRDSMNCPYCNEPVDQLDSIVKLPNGDRVHFKCSDKMLGEWAGLKAKLEQTEKALELASELHCVAGSCPNDDDCNDTGDCEKCWCNYFLTQAKEALNG